jgi:TonB family protein
LPIIVGIGGAALGLIVALAIIFHQGRPSPKGADGQPQATAPDNPSYSGGSQAPAGDVVKGAVTYQALPDVPETAVDTIQGHFTTRIRVRVDAQGNVADASIDSQGPSRYFAGFAVDAARNWKFRPARVRGRAVASEWLLEFQFARSGTEVTPTEVSP